MPSANFLAWGILIAFLVFITTRGELISYLGILGIGPEK